MPYVAASRGDKSTRDGKLKRQAARLSALDRRSGASVRPRRPYQPARPTKPSVSAPPIHIVAGAGVTLVAPSTVSTNCQTGPIHHSAAR